MTSVISTKTSGGGGIAVTGDTSGVMQLASNDGTTAVTIDASQNVGIGTSTMTSKLNIAGGITIGDYQNIGATSNSTGISLTGGSTTNNGGQINLRGGSFGTANAIEFLQGGTERMRIDSNGNVLVNNTSVVYGKICTAAGSFDPNTSTWATNGAALATFGGYGGGLVMIDGSAGYVLWAQDAGKDFYIRGNNIGSTPTGGVYINDRATSWSAASDENVKDIIEPIENAATKVSSLRAVIGKYKDEAEGKRHPFLIAQDVQAVLPEAVSIMNKGEESECLGLSYTDTIPLLVAAIQELKARIEVLEGAQA